MSFAKTSCLWFDKPEIEKPCPEFTLTYVTHYPKKQVTLNDFKGKWLFLDFWFTGCTSCIRSFPKINELQREFNEEVQFLLVGNNDSRMNRNIEEVFEKLRIKQGLNIAAAYDSILANRWGIQSMPHIVIINPQGIVKFITDGRDMTKEKIKKLLNGDPITFFQKDILRPDFDSGSISNSEVTSSKNNQVYRSSLSKWNGEKQYSGFEMDRFVKIPAREKGYKLAMVHLYWLYNTAYFGQYYFRILGDSLYGKICQFPILEMKDTSLFEYDFVHEVGKGLYNYDLFVPLNQIKKENIMRYMQQDLERAFGYHAYVEIRDMPVFTLIAKSWTEDKIRTKGSDPYNSASEESIAAGFVVRNVPVKDFITTLCYYLNEKEKPPFIDGTSISSNIDITIDADLTNLQDVKKALQKYGMDIVKSSQKMQVLIIEDPNRNK